MEEVCDEVNSDRADNERSLVGWSAPFLTMYLPPQRANVGKPYREPTTKTPPVNTFVRALTFHFFAMGTGTRRTMRSTTTLKIPMASSGGMRQQ